MKLKAYGKLNLSQDLYKSETEQFLDIEITHAIDLYTHRSEEEIIEIKGVDEDDIIELQDEDGYIEITSIKELYSNPKQVNERSGKKIAGDVILNDLVTKDITTRGGIKRFFQKIKILKVKNSLAELAVAEIAEMLEKKLVPREGIFQCEKPTVLGKKVAKIKASSSPILLLIHGTAANTHGTFGGFNSEGDRSTWEGIRNEYKNNIYAVEHRTLVKSPLENAIMVMEALPNNATIHLLTGSRGGLVGEILAQNLSETNGVIGFTELEISVFKSIEGREKEVKYLEKLNELFLKKKIRVERFVRVACPSAGTTLASKRLDVYFNIILNLIGMIPYLRASPGYKFIKSFLIAMVKKKADPTLLPGLEAMMPNSPLIRILNNPNKSINSDLVIISGDSVPRGGILKAIKVKLIDLFYKEDNDFIVNTAAMYGGIKRRKTHYFFHQHQTVSHFKYFSNPPTQKAILSALKGDVSSSAGFKVIEPEKTEEIQEIISERGRNKHLPTLFLVPGIMGSKLKAKGKKTWVNLFRLPFGAMDNLKINSPRVEAYDIMGSAYSKFVRHMSGSFNIVPFPYDWRKSVELAAKKLAKEVEKKLNETDKPIHVVAHSLGGLVVHAFYNNHKNAKGTGVWDRLVKREGTKILLLGSPLRGSHVIPQVMLREEKMFKLLHKMDLVNSQKDLLDILMKFPGILELLPENDLEKGEENPIDYFGMDLYKSLAKYDSKFVSPLLETVRGAKTLREKFKNDPLDGNNVFYIAGQNKSTPARLVKYTDDRGKDKYQLLGTARGDGRVTWDSGITDELKPRTWYMDATHGDMCNEPEFYPAIIDILRYGNTNALSKNEPALDRGVNEFFEIPLTEPVSLLSEQDYEASFMGVSSEKNNEIPLSTVKISITHGDLGYSRFPIAVGHHLGDGIVSAEKVIDNYMGGVLSKSLYSEIYPGQLETSKVFLNNGKDYFKGTVVIGIGNFGALSKGDLEKSFAKGLINLVMRKEEQFLNGNSKAESEKIGVSTLLIGSRYAGLSMDDSIKSLLNGVVLANEKLSQIKNGNFKQISDIEFVEIFEDRAISAAKTINRLIKDERYLEFELSSPLFNKVSGRRQKIADIDTNEWWYRLQITEEKGGQNGLRPMKFVSITDKARAEVRILPTQRMLVDNLLKSAIANSRFNSDLVKTLYALLIPSDFKDFASDKRDLMLLLDEGSARYPWELIHDTSSPNKKPIATQGGMVRQLATKNFNRFVKYPDNDLAFVLGNPLTPKDYSDLPGALQEAKGVAVLLKSKGFNVTTSFKENAEKTIVKLFSKNFKVLHIAGHGIVDENNPLKTGVVLNNGILITPAEIQQMTEVPEFVFINCCHSGVMKELENRNVLAANLGTQFIQKGVKAVVVAGWAVDDKAAKTFAEKLYAEMLGGERFGEAVRLAREETYQNYGDTNTWGAYQCYGDQLYQLKANKHSSGQKAKEYVHPKEALIDIKNVSSSSDVKSSGEMKYLVLQLENIIKSMPIDWIQYATISEALGDAFYELREYEKALFYYSMYKKTDNDSYSLLGLSNLSKLYMKVALIKHELPNPNRSQKAEIKRLVKQAEDLAKWLIKLGETKYRLSLIGGNYKRKSLMLTTKIQRVEALKQSRNHYKESYFSNEDDKRDENDFYSLLNWLTLEEVLEFYGETKSDEVIKQGNINELIKKAEKQLSKLDSKYQDFWSLVIPAAFTGFKLFEASNQPIEVEKLVGEMLYEYKKAWKLRGSLRKAENIMEHFRFVLGSLENVPRTTKTAKSTKLENTINTYQLVYSGLKEVFEE